jgi:membrane-bound lytic murein transglycosylase D
MSVRELARANGLSRHATLHPGQRLAVRPRAVDGAPLHLAGSRHATAATRQIAYRVRRGDTLIGIARRFDVSVGQLQAWNDLDDSSIRAGQRLKIRVDSSRDYGG